MDGQPWLTASPLNIILGLFIVLVLGLAFYLLGAMIIGRMRQARIESETDTSYPEQPASKDDAEALERIRSRQHGGEDTEERQSPL